MQVQVRAQLPSLQMQIYVNLALEQKNQTYALVIEVSYLATQAGGP